VVKNVCGVIISIRSGLVVARCFPFRAGSSPRRVWVGAAMLNSSRSNSPMRIEASGSRSNARALHPSGQAGTASPAREIKKIQKNISSL